VTTEEQSGPARVWYRRKKTGIIAAGITLLVVFILVSLPYGIQFGLADFLKQHGARQVEIENIDFNPFTGRLLFQNVRAVSGEAEALQLDRLELVMGWRELFSKRARIVGIEMQGLQAAVDLSEPTVLRVNGLSFPLDSSGEPSEPAAESAPWGFALDSVALSQCSLAIQRQDLSLDIELDRLDLERVISWRQEVKAKLNLQARVNTAPLRVELEAGLFHETRTVDGKIVLEGFPLSGLQPLLTEAGGPDLSGSLSLAQALKLSLGPSGEVSWQTDGSLAGEHLNLAQAQVASSDLSSLWQGTTTGGWSHEAGVQLQLDGALGGSVPQLRLPEQSIDISLNGYQWQGNFSLQPGEDAAVLSAEGEGALEGLSLSELDNKARLAELQRIELEAVKLAPGNQLALKGVRLKGLRLDDGKGDKGNSLLLTQSLWLKDIVFAQSSGLSIALIEQQGMQAELSLDKAGQLNLQRLAEKLQRAASPPASAEAAPATAETAEPMVIKIGRVVWQGENKATFIDRSVDPVFQASLDIKEFNLSAIDSSRPEQPSPFRLVGSTGRHAEITAEGEITLFQSDPDGHLKGQLKGIELVPLSSYTISAIGYNLDSGELDADIDLALKQGNLEGKNHLVIRRLDVSEASAAQAAKLQEKISMPLDSALGMLQDKNQTIDLNLPITGKLADPNVELGDVINTALGSALKKGAMTYLTTALFPYGTMVALLKMAGDEASAVGLNPVEFPPAIAELDDTDRDYLGKVAKVLKERPKIVVKLCGTATISDRLAMAQAMAEQAKAQQDPKQQSKQGSAEKPPQQEVPEAEMLALAKRRAEVVEDYLVNQHGVNASRTAVCRPTLDPEAENTPRVDLQL
jgi:hypothetical protein